MSKVTLKGGYYDTPLDINFIEEKEEKKSISTGNMQEIYSRAILVYGENGSGKSSIADALNSYVTGEIDSEYKVDLEAKDVTAIDENILKNNMYIYSETFIDKEVKYAEEGLNAVVMFGEQTEIEKDIKLKEEEMVNNNTLINNLTEKIETSKQHRDTQFNLISDGLKKDGDWADTDREIKGNKQKSTVSKNVIENIFSNSSTLTDIYEFKKSFKQNLEFYKKTREGKSKKLDYINLWEINKDKFDIVKEILLKEYHKPIEEETLKWLEKELTIRGVPFYQKVKSTMEDEETTKCPYCTQDIDENLKNFVLTELNIILDDQIQKVSKELYNYQTELANMKKELINSDDYKPLEEESNNLITEINAEIKLFNNSLDDIIKVVEKKIENPYQVYESHLRIPKNISENINFLNKNIKDYNDRIDNVASIKNNLLSQNKQIANYEYQSIYKSYKDAEKNLSELEDDLKNACSNKTKLDNEIHKLQLKKS